MGRGGGGRGRGGYDRARGGNDRGRGGYDRGRGGNDRGRGRGRGREGFSKRGAEGAAAEDLHPSWAAKKAKTDAVVKFQGKKTVFGETGDSKDLVSRPKDAAGGKRPQTSKDLKDKDVHPSWAAKQNQKAKILPFQGKKTVFED